MTAISRRIRTRLPMRCVTVGRGKDARQINVPDLAPFVAKGAKLLDERVPGWHRKVVLSTLQMASPERCVVGQLAIKAMLSGPLSDYHEAVPVLFGDNGATVAAEHGFAFPRCLSEWLEDEDNWTTADPEHEAWEQLTHLWSAEIRRRRRTAVAAKS